MKLLIYWNVSLLIIAKFFSDYVHNSIYVYYFAYLFYWWNIYANEINFFEFYFLAVSNIQERKIP